LPALLVFFFAPFVVRAVSGKENSASNARRNPLWEQAMRIPDHPTEIRRLLDARRARLAPGQPVLAATLTQVRKRCGQPTCHCYHGQPHLAWHLTYKVKGKTRTVYVPHDLLDEVRAWIAEHQRLKTLLDEIHQLTVALIRTHTRHQRRKAGRP
jgi:hypothetical protein